MSDIFAFEPFYFVYFFLDFERLQVVELSLVRLQIQLLSDYDYQKNLDVDNNRPETSSRHCIRFSLLGQETLTV